MVLGRDINYQMILQKKKKKLVITGRSDKDMYIDARKQQLGKDRFMNT